MAAFEIVSISIHLIAFVLAADALATISVIKKRTGILCLSSLLSVLISMQAGLYIYLDYLWIMNGHAESISSTENAAWAVQEWMAGVSLILTTILIKLFINLKSEC